VVEINRVSEQLKRKAPRKGELVTHFIDASAAKSELEKLAAVPLVEITKPIKAKLRRAYRKSGWKDASSDAFEPELEKFARQLIAAGVPILNRSSSRISKVIKGEVTIESLRRRCRPLPRSNPNINH
jgi:hypothetical protein